MKPARLVFTAEALITLGSGVYALVQPGAFAAQFVAEAPPGASLYFLSWMAACYVVIATLELTLLRHGDARSWRIGLPALFVGDILHILAHGLMLQAGGLTGPATWTSIGFAAVLGVLRVLCFRRPELVIPVSQENP